MRLFRHYLLGRWFVVCTDHNSLHWLLSFSYVEVQLAHCKKSLKVMIWKLFIDLANYILMRMRYLVFWMWIPIVLIIILVFLLWVFLVLRTVRSLTFVKKPMTSGLILLTRWIIFFRYLFSKLQLRIVQMFFLRCFLYIHGFLHIPWMIYVRHIWMMGI